MDTSLPSESISTIYESLADPRAIRLITLLPGNLSESISIELNIVYLDSREGYEALSYAWDDQKFSIHVACGPWSMLVTQNVHDALLELRSPEVPRYLWIDQLCINQQNLAERSKQVSLMGDIYTQADHAIVWLGKADHETASAFDAVRKLAVVYQCSAHTDDFSFVGSAKDIKEAVKMHCADMTEELRAAALDLPIMDSPEFRCLLGLMRRTWFKRMWVFQEAILASDWTEFRCGSYSCSMRDFYRAMKMFERCKYSDYLSFSERRAAGDTAVIAIASDNLRNARKGGPTKYDMEMLLVNTKRLKCQDPRDKVYAVLGICDRRYLPYITPDYTQPIADAYCAVVRAVLDTDRSLAMLGYIAWMDAKPTDLPSWVPDWRETRNPFGVTLGLRSIRRTRYYNACNNQPLTTFATSNPYHLTLLGTRFRRITRRLPIHISLRGEDMPLTKKRYQYPTWCNMFREEATRMKIPECCIRTRGYSNHSADDIICHQTGTARVNRETLLAVALRRTLMADLYPRPSGSRLEKVEWQSFFPHCARWTRQGSPTEPTPEVLREHDQYMDDVIRSRSLFLAGEEPDDAYLCLASGDTRMGDWICILGGGDVPVVLRPRSVDTDRPETNDQNTWEFICECYVDCIMDGEVFQAFYDPKMETFILD